MMLGLICQLARAARLSCLSVCSNGRRFPPAFSCYQRYAHTHTHPHTPTHTIMPSSSLGSVMQRKMELIRISFMTAINQALCRHWRRGALYLSLSLSLNLFFFNLPFVM